MKKIILLVLLIILILAYILFYLGIELELKSVVERIGIKNSRLIDSSFKIRNFMSIQLILTLLLLFYSIYLTIKKK